MGLKYMTYFILSLESSYPGQSDGEDLTKSDDDAMEDEAPVLRRKLGIPEPDPDALPSTLIGKYLMLAMFPPGLYFVIFPMFFPKNDVTRIISDLYIPKFYLTT